jgi:heme A synthase
MTFWLFNSDMTAAQPGWRLADENVPGLQLVHSLAVDRDLAYA